MKKTMPKLELIAACAIFGTIGVFRKAVPINSGMLSMLRGFIGALTLLIIMAVKRQKINWKAIKKNIVRLTVSGAAIGINWILCFESYNYTSIAISALCYYMAPVFVLIASSVLLKEKITKTNIICIIVALFGMVMVSGVLNETMDSRQMIGILLALAAAVLYATDVMCNKTMTAIEALDRTVYQLFIAGLVTVPYVIFGEEPVSFNLTFNIVLIVAMLGAVHTGIAFALYFDGLSKLSTRTVAFFTYIDPILAVLLSALLLKEGISTGVVIGAVCILGSALYNELKSN